MSSLRSLTWRVDGPKLRAHLLSLGLVEGSNKWMAVWFKKCQQPRFGRYT
jgi:hypothetical protein